jgi:hypothetical protein
MSIKTAVSLTIPLFSNIIWTKAKAIKVLDKYLNKSEKKKKPPFTIGKDRF